MFGVYHAVCELSRLRNVMLAELQANFPAVLTGWTGRIYTMPKRKKDDEMIVDLNIKRINHVAKLCKKKTWNKSQFVREAVYQVGISQRTAERAFDGELELSMETVERLAKLFNVTKEEVLESVW
jgi:uncharacterized protein (DUF2384 family)